MEWFEWPGTLRAIGGLVVGAIILFILSNIGGGDTK
jgi:Flp pilus assembly protein protease CpaA